MSSTYEIMFIVRPDIEEADLDKLIEGFSANIASGGGEIKSIEKMGRRRLAYTVRKFNDGLYVLLSVAAPGSIIAEIERRLRISEPVLKFITVSMDEEQDRQNKRQKSRDSKADEPKATSSNSYREPKAEEPKANSRTTSPLSSDQARLLLGLARTFSAGELKTAWKRKVSEWHPDKLDGMADELRVLATQRVQSLNEAYALLRT
jgi:small subunit ribosomal protein S6